jgi:hypothetical protein
MCFGGSDASKEIQEQEARRSGLIQHGVGSINRAFAGFDPQFYERQRQVVLASQLPQVGDQFRAQRNQLGSVLVDRGLLRSSAGATLGGQLTRELAQQQQNVSNQATQAVQGLQGQISTQKGQLLSQLQQSADPTLAAQRSIEAATQFSAPSIVQPLGNLFQQWASIYLAGQIGKIYGQQQQLPNQPRTLSPFDNNTSSSYEVKK